MSPERTDLFVRFIYAFLAVDLLVLVAFAAGWIARGVRFRKQERNARTPDPAEENLEKRQVRELVEKLAREQYPTLAGQ